MRAALLTIDGRELLHNYGATRLELGTAPEALLQGFSSIPDLEVHVISCVRRVMPSPEKLAQNIFFHGLHVSKISFMRTFYLGCLRAVRKKLKEIQPDIVHGQGTERDCAICAAFSGYPNVVTIHGNMAELARLFKARTGSYGWVAARLEDITLRRTGGVFCNSAYTEKLVRLRAKKTWRVPNALRRAFFDPVGNASDIRPPPCILLNVGTISKRKRQLELLEVVKALQRQGLKFQFHFIGHLNLTDDYAAAFRQRIKPLEANGCARYLGAYPTAELIRWFDRASGLVHFPSEEAFGLVVAEALARNLKFFGARLGGIIDIAEGAPGVELFAENDWPGLTASIARWINQGSPRVVGADTLMRERYHPAVIARRHFEIYRELLNTM